MPRPHGAIIVPPLHLQALNLQTQMINLTDTSSGAAPAATWTYFPPPGFEVSVTPAGDCSDGTTTCQVASEYCNSGASTLVGCCGGEDGKGYLKGVGTNNNECKHVHMASMPKAASF